MTILTKDNSQILRGLAIIAIALHNFLHIPKWGFSAENEMSFSYDRTCVFFEVIQSGQSNILCEIFSFLGWLGVPIFIFLTGYGLAYKSLNGDTFKPLSFIKKSWIKLFALMLPAVLFFILWDIIDHGISLNIIRRGFYLTQLVNFAYPYLMCTPGVYWYFGLTFQLYVIWACLSKKLNAKNLIVISILTLLGSWIIFNTAPKTIQIIYKHCFTGWFEIFALGIIIARNEKTFDRIAIPWYGRILLLCLIAMLIAPMNLLLETWLFLPIFGLFFFILAGSLLYKVPVISNILRWVGQLSSCIFVCHPIIRQVAKQYFPDDFSLPISLFIYGLLTILLAMGYKIAYKKLLLLSQKYMTVKKGQL